MDIDSFRVVNGGLFAAEIVIEVERRGEWPGQFKASEILWDRKRFGAGEERYVYFGWPQFDIAAGSVVRLKLFVHGGFDQTDENWFVYRPYSQTAQFVATGISLAPELRLTTVAPLKG